jgi:glyoxylase-like metal-dependent hydrolase (beta-lactamase superfamily II)
VIIDRVLAPNPSIYTGPGTNTYILSDAGEALVVDPGPVIASHELEIIAAIGGLTPVGVVATHTHPDHAPMANPLASRLGVPVLGFAAGHEFVPDILVSDGGEIPFGGESVTAVHTPGHTPDHLCFRIGETLLTGDHIMEGSTVIIEEARDYLDSLYLVRDLQDVRLEPGPGETIDDAGAAITAYIDHRLERERQIVAAVEGGAGTIGEIVDVVYAGLPTALRSAAVHPVGVQVKKLSDDSAVWCSVVMAEEETEVRAR